MCEAMAASERDAPANEATDFDWDDDDSVVAEEQRMVKAYLNPRNQLVIRQQGDYPHDEDMWVVVSREYVGRLISRLEGLEREMMNSDGAA